MGTVLSGQGARAQSADLPETRAVWVEEERFVTPAAAEATFARLRAAGINLALVKVWYRGATIYPSAVVAGAGGPRQVAEFAAGAWAGRDPLAEMVALGRRHGVRVGAWLEYGLAEKLNAADSTMGSRPPIVRANPSWMMRGRRGETAFNGSIGFQYWLDPAVPEVRAFIRDLCAEIARRYPDLAVVEYDRFRYPSVDFSYAAAAVARYMAETGNPDPRPAGQPADYESPYGRWRRAQVTRMAGEAYRAVKAANPSVVVTSAVGAPGVNTGVLQDWPAWADSGYVDALEPMLYGAFASGLATSMQRIRGTDGQPRVRLYPGTDVTSAAATPLQRVADARAAGAHGVTLWFDGNGGITDAQLDALATGPFATRVLPDFDDRRSDDSDAGTMVTGAWTTQATGDRGSRRLPAGQVGSAAWSVKTLHWGDYDLYLRWPAAADLTTNARVEVDGAGDVAEPLTFSLDQRAGAGGWVRVGTLGVGSGFPAYRHKTLRIGLWHGTDGGALVADGVRLVRVQPMRVEEVFVEDARTVLVRMTYPVASVQPSQFTIEGATVVAASVDATAPRFVRLTTAADLATGTPYVLRANVTATAGYTTAPGDGVTFTRSAASILLLDDGDTGFSTTGTWTVATGGTADDHRTAAPGASALWSTRLADGGRYIVEVALPVPVPGAAATQAYQVGHAGGFASVTLATGATGWQTLGTFSYDAGGAALVRLTAAAGQGGTLAADAVRWRRTLDLATASPRPEAPAGAVLTVAPNPATDAVRVRYAAPASARVRLDVFDALGRSVAARDLSGAVDSWLPVSHLAPGFYVVRLTVSEGGSAAVATVSQTFFRRP